MENKLILTKKERIDKKMRRISNLNRKEIERNSLCQSVEHSYDAFGFYEFNLENLYEDFEGDPSIIEFI